MFQFKFILSERLGSERPSAAGILGTCGSDLVEDDFLTRLSSGFTSDLGEEGLEAVVIVLAPLLIGMMMALRTLEALPQEDLRYVLELLLAVLNGAIPDDGWVVTDLSRGRNELLHEFVIGSVLMQGLADPGMEGKA